MARPDPIQYAERLYGAIRAANFSPISFLAFGNAIKEGVAMRNMPRVAAEPFMRVVGELLDLEEQADANDPPVADAVLMAPSPEPDSAATMSHEPNEDRVRSADVGSRDVASEGPAGGSTEGTSSMIGPDPSTADQQKQRNRSRKG